MNFPFVDALRKLMTPPDRPIDSDWGVLQENIRFTGTGFPKDYLEYSRVFGSAGICVGPYSWDIWSAARPTLPANAENFTDIRKKHRSVMETEDVPLGLFPEPGGLFPFGVRSNVWFTWKTDGAPDRWKVVVFRSYEHDAYHVFEMGFSEFLYKMLAREIRVAGFDPVWETSDIVFSQSVFDF